MSEPPAAVSGVLAPEDQARADFYALLSRLFADVPDPPLLQGLAQAERIPAEAVETSDDASMPTFPKAWDAVIAASAAANAGEVADEYQTLFIGVGRSEVSLYASHYLAPRSGRPLGDVRAALAELGLGRRPHSSQFEDHLAIVLETMRLLVAGDGSREPVPIDAQRKFFERFIASWAFECCTAIEQSSVANYYRPVAQLMRSFLALERDSLAME